jgi:predicted nucleotidyltransferase
MIGATHPTASAVLKVMEERGLLRSRIEGKNKTYHLRTSNIAVKEYLAIAERLATIEFIETRPFFKRLAEEAVLMKLPASVVLFGSHAKGHSTEESDVDLLIVGPVTGPDKARLKGLGSRYAKELSIKTASVDGLAEGIRNKDPLLLEVEADHIILSNHDLFLGPLWEARA